MMMSEAIIAKALLLNNLHTRCYIFVHFTVKCCMVAFAEHTIQLTAIFSL